MRCPVCGAKMVEKQYCKYCGVTVNQIRNSSNKQAKIALKEKRKQDVCYSTYMPSDVNKAKLVVFSLLFGFVGAGNFVAGKKSKAWYGVASFIVLQVCFALYNQWGMLHAVESIEAVTYYLMRFAALAYVPVFAGWICDAFTLLFKRYKIPVVLGPDIEIDAEAIKKEIVVVKKKAGDKNQCNTKNKVEKNQSNRDVVDIDYKQSKSQSKKNNAVKLPMQQNKICNEDKNNK